MKSIRGSSVPRGSRLDANGISADISSHGVFGSQRLKTVSGEITADIAGEDSELNTVSGDLTVRGTGKPLRLRARSVSGDIDLTNTAGSIDLVTVSGSARVSLVDAADVRGRTTSGDLEVTAKLLREGRIRPFEGRFAPWPAVPLDDTQAAADEMRHRLGL